MFAAVLLKLFPVIVTESPTSADLGVKDVIVGGGAEIVIDLLYMILSQPVVLFLTVILKS